MILVSTYRVKNEDGDVIFHGPCSVDAVTGMISVDEIVARSDLFEPLSGHEHEVELDDMECIVDFSAGPKALRLDDLRAFRMAAAVVIKMPGVNLKVRADHFITWDDASFTREGAFMTFESPTEYNGSGVVDLAYGWVDGFMADPTKTMDEYMAIGDYKIVVDRKDDVCAQETLGVVGLVPFVKDLPSLKHALSLMLDGLGRN